MNWKIERDPYMSVVARAFGEAAVWEAGFFEDDDADDAPLDDVDWLCIPTSIVRDGCDALNRRSSAAVGPSSRPVVLVATGGFWPPHVGHVEMMERARVTLESDGRSVVGGYLSPGHDHYLRMKWGAVAPPAAARLDELHDTIVESGWLAVDPWEALHRRTSVNYTDVVARLEAYLRCHVDDTIDVVFVCGGDNARFSLAFVGRGGCVVVGRPGSDGEFDRWRTDPRVATAVSVRWAHGEVVAASSSMDPTRSPVRRPRLRLRVEDECAVAGLGLDVDRWGRFQHELIDALAALADVEEVTIADQRRLAASIAGPTISLDPMIPGTVDLGVSRRFPIGGRGRRGHVVRPGAATFVEQLGAVADGSWTVVDDDVATGATMRFARSLLPAAVDAGEVVLQTRLDSADDIADSRDFLLGTHEGGLVVDLPNGALGRAPYLLPYVDPHARSSIPADAVLAFSRRVWLASAACFDGAGLTVSDLPTAAAATMIVAGHRPSDDLAEVCRWHIRGLDERAPL